MVSAFFIACVSQGTWQFQHIAWFAAISRRTASFYQVTVVICSFSLSYTYKLLMFRELDMALVLLKSTSPKPLVLAPLYKPQCKITQLQQHADMHDFADEQIAVFPNAFMQLFCQWEV